LRFGLHAHLPSGLASEASFQRTRMVSGRPLYSESLPKGVPLR